MVPFFLWWEIESPSALKQSRMREGAHDSQSSQALRQKGAHVGKCASDDASDGVSHHHNLLWRTQGHPTFPSICHCQLSPLRNSPASWSLSTYHLPGLATQVVIDRWLTTARGGNGQHNSPPNYFASSPSLATSALRGSYLSSVEQRQQNRAASSQKQGQCVASLVRGWAQEEYSEFCNSGSAWIANPLQTAGCYEVSTGAIISMIITNI